MLYFGPVLIVLYKLYDYTCREWIHQREQYKPTFLLPSVGQDAQHAYGYMVKTTFSNATMQLCKIQHDAKYN